ATPATPYVPDPRTASSLPGQPTQEDISIPSTPGITVPDGPETGYSGGGLSGGADR
ncbi:MAG: hypothetical protein JHD21_21455, partial [Nocardioides sp.]|nr:hypothetical protein [Nocardioides sp.]